MSETLKRLKPYARKMIRIETIDDYLALLPGGLENNVDELSRRIDLTPLMQVIDVALEQFEAGDTKSDAWLAPRVHATLRMTRREASDPGIWDYLTTIKLQNYVKWRWGDEEGNIPNEYRIHITSRNREIRHALWRLWWIAELSRNGKNYRPTQEAFFRQDTIEWFALAALNNRPTAQAFIRFLSTINDGNWAKGLQIKAFAKAFNHSLTTYVLDNIAEDPGPDLTAVESWINEEADPTLMFDKLPVGPDDPIEEEKIERVLDLMQHVYSKTDM